MSTMTMIITRNVPGRYRGFLASCMLEIAPGVYASPRLKAAVRERIWTVMLEWSSLLEQDAGVLMAWPDRSALSGMSLRFVGWPKKDIVNVEGLWLARSDPTSIHLRALKTDELLPDDEPEESS